MEVSQTLVKIEDVSKTFVRGVDRDSNKIFVRALKNVHFEIRAGEFTAVLGVSGSGKSTLINCLASLEELDRESGSIQYYDGQEYRSIWDDPGRYRQNFVGVVFQAFHLLPNLRVRENVEIPLRLRRCERFTTDRKARRQAVLDVLGQLGMEEHAEARISQLSGGECQRVAIARALVKKPRLVLADEPTGNLDEENKKRIIGELRGIASGEVAVLMVTHDRRYAEKYADRILTLKDGSIESVERKVSNRWVVAAEVPAVDDRSHHRAPGTERAENRPRSSTLAANVRKLFMLLWTRARLDRSMKRTQGDLPAPSSPSTARASSAAGQAAIDSAAPLPEGGSDGVTPAPDATEAAEPERQQGDPERPPESPPTALAASASGEIEGETGEAAPEPGGTESPVPSQPRPSKHRDSGVCEQTEETIRARGDLPAGLRADPGPAVPAPSRSRSVLRAIRIPGSDQGLLDLASYASRDARESSVSLISNIFAILFGTVLTTLIVSLLAGTDQYISTVLPTVPGIDSVHVWADYSTGAEPITGSDFDRLAHWPEAGVVAPNVEQFARLFERASRDTIVTLSSAIAEDPETLRLKLVQGERKLDPDGWDVLLTERAAKDLNNFNPLGLVGKEITLQLRRYERTDDVVEAAIPTQSLDYPVRVVGIVEASPRGRVYGSLNLVRFVRDFSTGRSDYTPEPGGVIDLTQISPRTMYESVRLHFAGPAAAETAFGDLKKGLERRFDVFWAGQEMLYLRDVQVITFIVLVGIGLLATIAGSISIFNTLLASVVRKVKEIGILRALGVARLDVFLIYIWQSLFIGTLAGVVGLVVSWSAMARLNAGVAERWEELEQVLQETGGLFLLPLRYALAIFSAVLVICLLAAFVPALRAAQKTPMDALRTN